VESISQEAAPEIFGPTSGLLRRRFRFERFSNRTMRTRSQADGLVAYILSLKKQKEK
jgi:hypothetical protein